MLALAPNYPDAPSALDPFGIFKETILPTFPIFFPDEVDRLKDAKLPILPIEFTKRSLIFELGAWLINIHQCWGMQTQVSLNQTLSQSVAEATVCIQNDTCGGISFIQACLLMALMLRQNAQDYHTYLRLAAAHLKKQKPGFDTYQNDEH